MSDNSRLDFWNARSHLGYCAGTNDFVLKEMEVKAIAGHVKDGMHILDFGCGNCVTAIALAKMYDVRVHCIDFSPDMIAEGEKAARGENVAERFFFRSWGCICSGGIQR